MKTILTLLLLLIPFAGFSQDVDKALGHIGKAFSHIDSAVVALQKPEIPINNFQVAVESPNIFKVDWLSTRQGTGNIEYGIDGFQYSYANNVSPIELQSNSVNIGVGRTGTWQFRFVTDDWISDTLYVSNQINAPPEPVEAYPIWHGLFDSRNYSGDEFNTIFTSDFNVAREVTAAGKNCILSLSHRWLGKTQQQWEGIIDWTSESIKTINPDKVIIFIQDEPLGAQHGFEVEEVQWIYDEYKKRIPEYTFGYSFTRHSVRNIIPEEGFEVDFALLPMYLFSGDNSRESFDSYFDEHIAIAKRKMDADIYIIGQGFYNPPGLRSHDWTKPPIEAPYWYLDAIWRNNLKGMVWWPYKSSGDTHFGLDSMPDYFERILETNDRIPER